MKQIAFYCRTSTLEQRKGESIGVQVKELEKSYKGQSVVKKYLDDGFSGSFLQRPALIQVREDARRGMFNVLALYSLDRLSRKTGHQLFLQDELKKYGIEIEILGKKFEDTPQGEFSKTILSAVAQLEKEMIRKRMLDGIYRKIDNKILVGCPPPFGYTLIKRDRDKRTEASFVVNPKEARMIQIIFRIFLDLQSIRQTAEKINELGVCGRIIYPRRIAEWLRDETYIGNFYYRKSKTYLSEESGKIMSKRVRRPKEEWKLIEIPAIIDKRTFSRAQEILRTINKNYNGKSKYHYLLQGVIRCSHCGAFYGGKKVRHSKGEDYFIYLCHNKRTSRFGKEMCHSKSIGSRTIERQVLNYLDELFSKPEKLKTEIKNLQEQRDKQKNVNGAIYDRLQTEKANLKTKKSKILDLYTDERISREDLDSKMEETRQQEIAIDKQIAEIENELQRIDEINEIEKEVDKVCLEYKKRFNRASFELKKIMIKRWIKKITIPDKGLPILSVVVPVFDSIPFDFKKITGEKHYAQLCDTQKAGEHLYHNILIGFEDFLKV